MIDMNSRNCIQIWRWKENPCQYAGYHHIFCEAREFVIYPCQKPTKEEIKKEIKGYKDSIQHLNGLIEEYRERILQLHGVRGPEQKELIDNLAQVREER